MLYNITLGPWDRMHVLYEWIFVLKLSVSFRWYFIIYVQKSKTSKNLTYFWSHIYPKEFWIKVIQPAGTVEERRNKTEIRLVLNLTQPCGSIAKIKPLTKGLLLLFHDIFSTCDLLTEMWQWGCWKADAKVLFPNAQESLNSALNMA